VLLGSCVTPDTQLISLWHHDTNPPTVDSLTIVSQHGRLPWVSAAPLTPELRDSIRQAVGTKRCRELTL